MNPLDTGKLYGLLVEDDDARVCRDIDDSACQEVPGNFFRQLAASTLTKLGDQLISPKTTLTWIFGALAAPVWMIGWLVPLRESGSLLPQLVIAAFVRSRPIRKWVWVAGGVLQGFSVLGMAAITLLLDGSAAGWALLGGVVVFSLSRGLCSVASKDVTGKTVPKTRRGRLGGFASSAAGLMSIAAALLLLGVDSGDPAVLATLLAIAGSLWLVACVFYAQIREFPGATEGGANALTEAWARLSLLRDDRAFRNFVLARSLLLVSALTGPYLVLMAKGRADDGLGELPLFIIAGGLASFVSSPFWGRLSDQSSRRTMIIAALLSAAIALVAIGFDVVLAERATAWGFIGLFFCLCVAHDGVRLGRKTYIVDLAEGNRRTDYVAVANTAMGITLLGAGALTGWASTISISAAVGLLAAMGIGGAFMSARLPEVQ